MLKRNFLTFFHTEIEFKSTGKILILINLWQYQPPDKHWVLSPSNFFFKPSEFAFMVPIISRWQDMVLKSMGKYG